MFYLSVYITVPLMLLIAFYFATRFPLTMAVLLFFLGPFVGTCVLVTVGELSKPTPVPSHIAAAVPLLYLGYGLPIFGLWVAAAGVVGWWIIRRFQFVQRMSIAVRELAGAAMGLVLGPILVFTFWTLFSLDSRWPRQDTISRVLLDPISLLSLLGQGVLAGAICGPIVAHYLDRETKWRHSTKPLASR
jgi:hypothetical protein